MKVLGIVAEFNPFHNGHKYLIETAKKETKADIVIVVMSGNFTQQGNIAIYNKFDRAKLAIDNGVDIVIELPTIFSISSAQSFCFKAIQLLNSLNCVDYIAFGAESELNFLNNISSKILENETLIWNSTVKHLKKGISFAAARYETLKNILTPNELLNSCKSNNILALNYLLTLKKLNSSIIPISIKREGNDYNDKNLHNSSFSSASSIRQHLENQQNLELLKSQVPTNVFNYILENTITKNEYIFLLIKYKIIELGKDNLKNINEITEGIENRIYEAVNNSTNYENFIDNIKSKRYQMSKVKRILLNILLNITKEDFNKISNENLYAHILALSKTGKKYLSSLNKSSNIPIIIKKTDFNNISNPNIIKSLNFDILASNIYSIINNTTLNKDFLNKI